MAEEAPPPPRHVLYDLGYKELGRVTCGLGAQNKQGIFYGGHDNVDIFVRCLCNSCSKKPPVAADEGGCIFNCCQKWKESVRYAERRVVDHLKDRSAALGGQALVGSMLWVCWLRERAFYLGVVRSWDPREGKYVVQYADGDVERLYLGIELVKPHDKAKPAWVDTLPPPPVLPVPAIKSRNELTSRSATLLARAGADPSSGPRPRRKDITAPGAPNGFERLPATCTPAPDGTVTTYAMEAMQQRTLWRTPHAFHGFDILNIDAITKHYPAVRAEVLKHDVIQWLNMDEAQRAQHVAARAVVQVAHTLPGGVSCATQPMLRGDLVGSVAGVVRVSGEVAKEGSGGADGVRVFESTARGQFGWPQELCMDSRNSEQPLGRLRQVSAMARGQANVAVLEVEEHLPVARGGGHVLHMIVVLLDDVAAGAPLVAVRNKSWVLVDKVPAGSPRDATHATVMMALSPMRHDTATLPMSRDVAMPDAPPLHSMPA